MANNLKKIPEPLAIYLFDLTVFLNKINRICKIKYITDKLEYIKSLSEQTGSGNEKKAYVYSEKFTKIFEELLPELKNIKCDNYFLNEKTDLIARTYMLKEYFHDLEE